MSFVIGFAGKKGAGKDTAATLLIEAIESLGLCVERDMFAADLKNMLSVIGYPTPDTPEGKEAVIPELGVTWRHMAQTLGTEWRQLIHPHLWLKTLANRAGKSQADVYVVTDVRFEYEAKWVRQHGWLVHIDGGHTHADTHVSESGIDPLFVDFFVDNYAATRTVESLRKQMALIAQLAKAEGVHA